MRRPVIYLALITVAVALACARGTTTQGSPQAVVPSLDYAIVHTYPHDPDAFTQGLLFHDGFMYESTGRNGFSSVRKVRLETGEVLRRVDVPEMYFAEGLALAGRRLVQLTWQAQMGFVYDLDSFAKQGTFDYQGEGWGLTTDGSRLIMSDGTPAIRFLDAHTLRETGRITVRDAGTPVKDLNELEMVGGALFANVWLTSRIVRIDPKTGAVTGHLDLDRITPAAPPGKQIDVLNGIAWDAQQKRLFVTGKLWPSLYEIAIEPEP
jgi:glutaminyl-peptide cyclotransferase